MDNTIYGIQKNSVVISYTFSIGQCGVYCMGLMNMQVVYNHTRLHIGINPTNPLAHKK